MRVGWRHQVPAGHLAYHRSMVIVAQTFSPRLRKRFATVPRGVHEFGDDPRSMLDIRPAQVDAWFVRDRDRAAYMLLHLDDPRRVLDLGLDHLVREIGTARGDAGMVDRGDRRYRPTVVIADGIPAELVASTALPNHHPVLQAAWSGDSSVTFDRVARNRALGSLAPVFEALGTTAMLARAIHHGGLGLGLLCIDEVEGERRWTDGERRRVDDFVDRWLGPILHASVERSTRPELSSAEAAAVSLLATGLTYAEIARRLGKSARTIDNQLRSARRKLGARNSMELVRAYEARTLSRSPGGNSTPATATGSSARRTPG